MGKVLDNWCQELRPKVHWICLLPFDEASTPSEIKLRLIVWANINFTFSFRCRKQYPLEMISFIQYLNKYFCELAKKIFPNSDLHKRRNDCGLIFAVMDRVFILFTQPFKIHSHFFFFLPQHHSLMKANHMMMNNGLKFLRSTGQFPITRDRCFHSMITRKYETIPKHAFTCLSAASLLPISFN